MSQYTITGFDASAHLSEETHKASWSAPIGVLTSIIVSAVFGWFLILCLLFSIQDFDKTVGTSTGQPVLQILLDIFSEDGAIVLFTLIIVCVWHCGLFSLTSNSRMMFAFGMWFFDSLLLQKLNLGKLVTVVYPSSFTKSTNALEVLYVRSGLQRRWLSSWHSLRSETRWHLQQLHPLPQSAYMSHMAYLSSSA